MRFYSSLFFLDSCISSTKRNPAAGIVSTGIAMSFHDVSGFSCENAIVSVCLYASLCSPFSSYMISFPSLSSAKCHATNGSSSMIFGCIVNVISLAFFASVFGISSYIHTSFIGFSMFILTLIIVFPWLMCDSFFILILSFVLL